MRTPMGTDIKPAEQTHWEALQWCNCNYSKVATAKQDSVFKQKEVFLIFQLYTVCFL